MRMSPLSLLLALPLVMSAETLSKTVLEEQSEQANFVLKEVTGGFDFAWDLVFLPDGSMLISEYDGRIRRVADGRLLPDVVGRVEVTERGGLRGISLHPQFDQKPWLYACHASGSYENNHTRISMATWDGESLGEFTPIFVADNSARQLAHYGCRMVWDTDTSFIASLGDRRHHAEASQSLNDHYGVAVRLEENGAIPADNPFSATRGVKADIWAFGIRNIQGMVQHPDTGVVWTVEHGPLGGDEINVLEPGKNYGWPVATFGIDYDRSVLTETPLRPEVTPPLYYWYPSIAPSSVSIYTGPHFPKWQGDVFITTLASQEVLRMEVLGDRIIRQENLLGDLNLRLRNIEMGPDGYLYLLTDAGDGRLMRFEPAN